MKKRKKKKEKKEEGEGAIVRPDERKYIMINV